MATDFAPPVMSGLMIPDPRIITGNLDATDSTYTQAGPFPGAVVSQDTPLSQMTFRPSGTQSANKQLRLKCARGGYPTVSSVGGGLYWYYQGDSEVMAWDAYNVITGFEWVAQITNVSTTEYANPTSVTLDNGTVLLAYRSALTGAADDVITVKSLVPGGAWTTLATVTPSDQHAELYPELLLLPDGSVLLFYWTLDTSSNIAQVVVARSADNGATWSTASSYALRDGVDTSAWTVGRLVASYSVGQILLVAALVDGGGNNEPLQLASDDHGASFTAVHQWRTSGGDPDATDPVIFPKVGGGFQLVLNEGGTSKPRDLPTAFSNSSTITAGSSLLNPASVGLVDQDRNWYTFGENGNRFESLVSRDEGATWVRLVHTDADHEGPYSQAAAGNLKIDGDHAAATYMEGRAVIVCKFASAGTSTIDTDSLACIYVGGSSNLTMPSDADRIDGGQAVMGLTWLPVETPTYSTGITEAVTGTPTESFTSTGYRVQTAAGSSSLYWTDDCSAWALAGTDSVLSPFDVHFMVTVGSGGSLAGDNINVTITHGDPGERFRVRFNITTTGFRVVDLNAGGSIADVTVDMTAGVEVRVGMRSPTGANNNDGILRVFYRLSGTQSTTGNTWTVGPSSTTLTTGAGAYAPLLEWGAPNQAATDVTWTMMLARIPAGPTLRRGGWAAGQAQHPRPISRHAIGIDDGVRVEAIDGPAYEGETWNVDTRYQYGVECMDPTIHPSPQRKHRTTDETQHEYAWDLHGLTANSRLGLQTVALYLEGINWRSGELFGKTNGGAYVSLGTIDSAVNRNGLKYSLVGDVVTVNTATTTDAAEYIHYNDFAGGTFFLADGKPRKIIRHTEGSWTDQLTRRPEFFLEGIDGTEATTGTVGAIWSPRLLVVVHNLQEYRHLKLRVDAQTTADGYLETGIATIGPVHIFGQGYSWGRRVTVTPNGSLTTRRDGSRVARRNGEPRMAVDLAWRDGVNEWTLYPTAGGNPVPNYMTGTSTGGTQPIATPYDTAHKVQGIAHELAEDMPCVYVPRIDRGTPDLVQYASRWDMLYGRIRGPVGLENIIGDSRAGEFWRIANVRIEQEQ